MIMPSIRTPVFFAALAAAPALAQTPPGDADFCAQYAEAAATAAEDAIALNPACLDYSTGVHDNRQMHVEWCSRTPSDKAEGAAANIRRLASRCTKGALAAPTEYGGYDIAGNERFERPYGQARQWDVRAAYSGRTFMYCVAATRANGYDVRIGMDLAMPGGGGQWQLAVPVRAPRKEWEGTLEVDGRGAGDRGGAYASGSAVGGWSIAWLDAGQIESMRKGRRAILGVDKFDYDFPLDGVAAALLKVEECRSRKGDAPVAAASPQASPKEASRAAAVVNAPVIFPLRANTGLCVRHVGGDGPESADLELSRCDSPAGLVFLLEAGGGPIRLSERTDYCASVDRMPAPPESVTMIPCRDTRDRWRYDERSGQIRNGENYCWTVDRRAFHAGAKILGAPCKPNAPEQQFDRRI